MLTFARTNGDEIQCKLHKISVHHQQAQGMKLGEEISLNGCLYEVVGLERNWSDLAMIDLELRTKIQTGAAAKP